MNILKLTQQQLNELHEESILGMLWCITRVLLPSASGRKIYNVLGAYNSINNEVITLNNDTYSPNLNLIEPRKVY